MTPSVLMAVLALGQTGPDPVDLLARLDLTSFVNSTGPRALSHPTVPEEAGFTHATVENGWAVRTDPSGPWRLGLQVLKAEGDAVLVCFYDEARNGGSYYAQMPLSLRRSGDVYVAAPAAHEGCREVPGDVEPGLVPEPVRQ